MVQVNSIGVVSIGHTKPERALNAFKAYATRQLRADGLWSEAHSPWADRGSKIHLWNERSLALAIEYVINGQGANLPEFGLVTLDFRSVIIPSADADGTDILLNPSSEADGPDI